MKGKVSHGEKYGPVADILTQEAADAYFNGCVEHTMTEWGRTRDEAIATERQNIGYWAGYYDRETAARIHKLFRCYHPILGSFENDWPTVDEAYSAGKKAGET